MVHVWSINSGERFQGHHGPLVSFGKELRYQVSRQHLEIVSLWRMEHGLIMAYPIPTQ